MADDYLVSAMMDLLRVAVPFNWAVDGWTWTRGAIRPIRDQREFASVRIWRSSPRSAAGFPGVIAEELRLRCGGEYVDRPVMDSSRPPLGLRRRGRPCRTLRWP